ncbi:sulfide/dihydroorotate dehydrogenase-like FAD/NAD-binding protein [bacterium]|nr:sulfide/dihydroorotate dehydrogenase-like FAD/NAD-binding protein [bacterium]MBT4552881.1 sulfide/dihydroorotate dehydrogenase-like FAD/NAD-binding protein [bacterium]
MYQIIEKQVLTPVSKLFVIKHPQLAQKAQAGQFVIIRLHEKGERIPLTIADFDAKAGTISLVVQEVGKTSQEMGALKTSDQILDLIGPLGYASHIQNYGTVICIGGGLGIAPIYPIARALKKAGNRVLSIIGARNQELLFWEDKMRAVSDELYVVTDDGSSGHKGLVTEVQKELINKEKIQKVFAIGPAIMMKFVVETSRPHQLSTIVSLNSIMIDGTGMCGGCRVQVGGVTKFACVDGPEFEGLDVDFDNLFKRLNYYRDEEKVAIKKQHLCRLDNIK